MFETALLPNNHEIGNHLVKHGDGVKDVAFAVDNLEWILETAKKNGAKVVQDLRVDEDEDGTIKTASLQTVITLFGFYFMINNLSTETQFIRWLNGKTTTVYSYLASNNTMHLLTSIKPCLQLVLTSLVSLKLILNIVIYLSRSLCWKSTRSTNG